MILNCPFHFFCGVFVMCGVLRYTHCPASRWRFRLSRGCASVWSMLVQALSEVLEERKLDQGR